MPFLHPTQSPKALKLIFFFVFFLSLRRSLRFVKGEQRELQPFEGGGGGAEEEAGEDGQDKRRACQYGAGEGGKLWSCEVVHQ